MKVAFFTDCEGDFSHLCNCVEESEVLCWIGDQLAFTSDDTQFVFGGDAFDRGNADIRIGRTLVAFKQAHPSRVTLLMGNRDINKMRFTSELNTDVYPSVAFHAFWDAKAPRLDEWLQESALHDTPLNRLKWMLAKTLGCPDTFELRREELGGARVDDEAVFASFVDAVSDTGVYTTYLQHAQLAHVIEDVLFVHGAADARALGFIPDMRIRFAPNDPAEVTGRHIDDLHEWVHHLNAYAQACVREWRQQPLWDATGRRGGDSLLAYQNKPAINGKTVCIACYVDGKNMADRDAFDPKGHRPGLQIRTDPFISSAVEYLRRGGICRICVGHTPSGEAPATLHRNAFIIVSADTNYAVRQGNGRGGSCCVVILTSSETRLRGRLADGHGTFNCIVEGPIGTKIDNWWVKLRLDDGRLLLSRGTGRDSESKFVLL